MDLTDPTLTAEQIAEETMIEEAEEYFFGFPLDEAAWRRNGRLHAAKDAEIAALRDRLARAEERERELREVLAEAEDAIPPWGEYQTSATIALRAHIAALATPTDGAAGEGEASDGQ
jgi:hypothetical protein